MEEFLSFFFLFLSFRDTRINNTIFFILARKKKNLFGRKSIDNMTVFIIETYRGEYKGKVQYGCLWRPQSREENGSQETAIFHKRF